VLRIFHPYADTTVVSRAWSYNDEITARGAIKYVFNLIFTGQDNEVFLKAPAKAFELSSYEPYLSFVERVKQSPDAPTKSNVSFDPRPENYAEPTVFSRETWEREFGIDAESFKRLYVYLYRAITAKGTNRVAVQLPESVSGERFSLAVLSVMPLWLKKRFGVSASWSGQMDGGDSVALEGVQLLCYNGSEASSKSNYPVIDLMNGGNHQNIDDTFFGDEPKNGTYPADYAQWVWENIDKPEEIDKFNVFMLKNFERVVGVMPLTVISTCFLLWQKVLAAGSSLDLRSATVATILVAESFASQFSNFKFIADMLKRSLDLISTKVKTDELNRFPESLQQKLLQAVALLAINNEPTAQTLVQAVYDKAIDDDDYAKVGGVLSYYIAKLKLAKPGSVDEASAVQIMLDCFGMDAERVKAAYDALSERALRLRNVIAGNGVDDNMAANLVELYKSITKVMSDKERLPQRFFTYSPEQGARVVPKRVLIIERFDAETLGMSATAEHLKVVWTVITQLEPQDKNSLLTLYWSKAGGDMNAKRDYVMALERAKTDYVRAFYQFTDEQIRGEIDEIFRSEVGAAWGNMERDLSSDDTWELIGGLARRLAAVGISGGAAVDALKAKTGIDDTKLIMLSEYLSQTALSAVRDLYGSLPALDYILKVDQLLSGGGTVYGSGVFSTDRSSATILYNRLQIWHGKSTAPPVEWSFLISVFNPFKGDFSNPEFIPTYVELRGQGTTKSNLDVTVMVELFGLAAFVIKSQGKIEAAHRDFSMVGYILDALEKVIMQRLNSRNNAVALFSNSDVIKAFTAIPETTDWKRDKGAAIYREVGKLLGDSDDASLKERIEAYKVTFQQRTSGLWQDGGHAGRGGSGSVSEPLPMWALFVQLGTVLLGIVGILMIFLNGGSAALTEMFGSVMSWLAPILAAVLLIVSGVLSGLSIKKRS
jgi:hypothetical protein